MAIGRHPDAGGRVSSSSRRLAVARRACLLVLLFASLPAAGDDRFESVRRTIEQRVSEQSIPSIAVAVAKDGHILWEQGFGWADRERRIAATPDTMYPLASISKPIAATGLMTLVQAGLIELDAPINRYLGGTGVRVRIGDADRVTVRNVANHSSGLPTYHRSFYADEPYLLPTMEETIARYGNVLHAPGSGIHYSNLGYGALGHVMERVSGKRYGDFMREAVFAPLGLRRMSLGPLPGLEDATAVKYDANHAPLPAYASDTPAAGGVYSSVHDLVRFGMFHLQAHLPGQSPILSEANIAEMQRQTSTTHNPVMGSYGYGLGFMVSRKGDYRLVSHSGSLSGATTQLYLVPEHGIVIAVLSNISWPRAFDIPDLIAASLLPDWPTTPQSTTSENPAQAEARLRELAGRWKGILATYQGEVPLEFRFLPSGEVHARLGDQLVALVNDARFGDGRFSGRFAARIGTEDTERFAYVINVLLDLHGNALTGLAQTTYWDTGFATEARSRDSLPHWVSLQRQAAH